MNKEKLPQIRGVALKLLLSDPEVGRKARTVLLAKALANEKKQWGGFFTECLFAPTRAKDFYKITEPKRKRLFSPNKERILKSDFNALYGQTLTHTNLYHYATVINNLIGNETIVKKNATKTGRKQIYYYLDSTKELFLQKNNNFILRYLHFAKVHTKINDLINIYAKQLNPYCYKSDLPPIQKILVCNYTIDALLKNIQTVQEIKEDFFKSTKTMLNPEDYPNQYRKSNLFSIKFPESYFLITGFIGELNIEAKSFSSDCQNIILYLYLKEIISSKSSYFKFKYLFNIPFEGLGLQSFNEQKKEILTTVEKKALDELEHIKKQIQNTERKIGLVVLELTYEEELKLGPKRREKKQKDEIRQRKELKEAKKLCAELELKIRSTNK